MSGSTPCYICGKPLDEIEVGPDLRPEACSECLSVIQETVDAFDESVDEYFLWDSEDG